MKIKILTVFAVLLFSAFGAAALERPPVLPGGTPIDGRALVAPLGAHITDTTDIRNARTIHALMQGGVAMEMPM